MVRSLASLALLQHAAAEKPHILMLVMDDLGWNDLGFRSSVVSTPHIDSMAAEGVMLQNYYVMPSCAPTRSTIMTGRHVTRTGIYTPFAGVEPEGVPLDEVFLPQVLKKGGYATHMVGKWHLGFYKEEYTPTFRGFDTFYGFYGWGEDYFSHMVGYFTDDGQAYDFRDEVKPNCGAGCTVVDHSAAGTYSTHLFAQRASQIISQHNPSTPLFLYLPWQAVHAPKQAPQKYKDMYAGAPRDAMFCGMVSAADEGIKNVTSALEAKGMLDNTLIIFTSDNGGPIDAGDGIGSSNYPLRGGKHSFFEGGVRGTAFVWSKQLKAREHWGLMHSVDWLPTLAHVAGVSTEGTKELDGMEHWGQLSQGGSKRNALFLGCSYSKGCAVRKDKWKLIIGDPVAPYEWSPENPKLSLSDDPSPYDENTRLLYDVSVDPGEHNDLSKDHPDVVADLEKFFENYDRTRVGRDFALDKSAPKGRPIDGVWGPWVNSDEKLLV